MHFYRYGSFSHRLHCHWSCEVSVLKCCSMPKVSKCRTNSIKAELAKLFYDRLYLYDDQVSSSLNWKEPNSKTMRLTRKCLIIFIKIDAATALFFYLHIKISLVILILFCLSISIETGDICFYDAPAFYIQRVVSTRNYLIHDTFFHVQLKFCVVIHWNDDQIIMLPHLNRTQFKNHVANPQMSDHSPLRLNFLLKLDDFFWNYHLDIVFKSFQMHLGVELWCIPDHLIQGKSIFCCICSNRFSRFVMKTFLFTDLFINLTFIDEFASWFRQFFSILKLMCVVIQWSCFWVSFLIEFFC